MLSIGIINGLKKKDIETFFSHLFKQIESYTNTDIDINAEIYLRLIDIWVIDR